MVHVPYDVTSSHGAIIQRGTGPFYFGSRFQQGYGERQYGKGIASLLSRSWKRLIPWAKEHVLPVAKDVLSFLTQEGAQAGSNALSKIAAGEGIKESVNEEAKSALKNVVRKTGARLTQAGKGRKRRKRNKVRRSLRNLHTVGRSVLNLSPDKKRRKVGPLGLY